MKHVFRVLIAGLIMSVELGGCSNSGEPENQDPGVSFDAVDSAEHDADRQDMASPELLEDTRPDSADDIVDLDTGTDSVDTAIEPPVSMNRLADTQYLVISADHLADAFRPLVEWKRTLGLSAKLVTVSEILAAVDVAGQTGITDTAAIIRQYLKVLHAGGSLRYVLLGGDHPEVPRREIWATADVPAEETFVQDWVASDFYYADIDGDWNADGDDMMAEPEDGLDMLPDLAVARLPVDTAEEVATYLEKLRAWDTAENADYQDTLMFMAAWVANIPGVGDVYSSPAFEGLLAPLVPETIRLTRMYDDYEAFPGSFPYSAETERDAFAAGTALAINMGHGNTNSLAELRSVDLSGLEYTGRPPVYWTTECYSGMFDNEDGECAAERFIRVRGGGVAFVGNSDFGVGMPSIMNLFEAMLRGLYSGAADTLGDVVVHGLSNYSTRQALDARDDGDRFTNLVLVVFGDPSIRMWTGPVRHAEFSVSGQGLHRQVVVDIGGQPAGAGITVAVYAPDNALYTGLTGDDGEVEFRFPELPGPDWTVTVSGPNLPAVTHVGLED